MSSAAHEDGCLISEMLGHANVTVTLKVYAHVLPSMQEAAAGAMDLIFGDKPLGSVRR